MCPISLISFRGIKAQCSDATYKSYKKQLAKLPSSSSSSKAGGGSGPVDKEAQFTIGMKYGQGPAVSKAGIDRLSKDIVDHQEDRKKLSRRRMTAERFDLPHMGLKFENFITLNILLSFLEPSDHSSLTHESTTLSLLQR